MTSGSHAPGRPRSLEVDTAILEAALEIFAARGPEGLTMNAVARRSGVARASIYLRFPGRDALLTATVRAAVGREPFPLTGDLRTDLRLVGGQAQAILSNPGFREALPEIVRGLLRQPDGTDAIRFEIVAPNRVPIADEYRRLAAGAGLRTDIDPDLPAHLILGSLLGFLLAEGVPPTPERAAETAEIVIDGLRARDQELG
jgi:AcrR family transcriptional regulator